MTLAIESAFFTIESTNVSKWNSLKRSKTAIMAGAPLDTAVNSDPKGPARVVANATNCSSSPGGISPRSEVTISARI